MTDWVKNIAAGLAAIALALPTAPISAQDAHQVTDTPQGGFTLKVNNDLVLTNVVARDYSSVDTATASENDAADDAFATTVATPESESSDSPTE